MDIERLTVKRFRNLKQQTLNFNSEFNIIYGNNGQGKTSVLEAIYLLALTRSFRANSDKILLQHDQVNFDVHGQFRSFESNRSRIEIRAYYSEKEGKHFFYNGNQVKKFSEIIGIIPVILLSLEDLDLMYGVPANRRRFLNIILSQVSPLYLKALQNYKRLLAQRNQLLTLIKEGKESKNALYPWNKQFVEYGVEIIYHRLHLLHYFNEHLSQYYRALSENKENIKMHYQSNIGINFEDTSKKTLQEAFQTKLKRHLINDVERENTHNGPHRDDVVFYKDKYPIKSFGSQGENKTFLIALKLLESAFIKSKVKEKPLLLLDDIFGELDVDRIKRLIDRLRNIGQTFITTTLVDKFRTAAINDHQIFFMSDGVLEA